MSDGAADFPFPFFGAGEATYFEWAEVHVELARRPTAAEKRAIAKRVPVPLRDSIDFDGSHLMVASDQFVHVAIAETYDEAGRDRAKATTIDDDGAEDEDDDEDDDDDDDDDDDGFGQLFFARDDQVSAFNRDLEAWLRDIHAICPVKVAFRAEDHESGGTELSDWHRFSVHRIPDLLPWLEQVARAGDDEDDEQRRRAYMARGILAVAVDAGLALPESLRDWLEPGRKELLAIAGGEIEELRQLFAATPTIPAPVLDRLSEEIDPEDPGQCDTLLAAADLLIDEEELPADLLGLLVATAARRRHDTAEIPPPLGAQITTVLAAASQLAATNSRFGDVLGVVGHQLATNRRFHAAIEVFDLLVDLPDLAKTTYCNALWVIQADNNRLPVDPVRARRFLAGCVPHGPDNPAIFFNAACVHMELREYDKVLESLEAAIAAGYDKIELMQHEPLFAAIAGDPEFVAIFERARARG